MSFSIGGLASGLDTNTIIQQLMQIERQPFVRLEASKKNINSHQSTFRSLNTKLRALQDVAFDLSLASSFRGVTSTSSDETVARVTSTSSASTGEFDLVVKQLAKAHVVRSNVSVKGTDPADDFINKSFTISDGNLELEIRIDQADSIEQALEQIKANINNSALAINASVIETTGGKKEIVFTAKQLGEDHKIKFEAGEQGSDLLSALGITLTDDGDVSKENTAQSAQNAMIELNGISIERSSNTLTNVIEGVTINLLKESDEGESNARSKIQVKTDTEQVIEKVEEFVNAYNEVITMVRGNLKKDSKLQGNATLRNLDTQLFNWTNSKVGADADAFNFLFELGITIDKGITVGSEMTGKMSIDTKLLTEKLEEDADAFMKFFRGENGFAKMIDQNLRAWTSSANGILTKAIQSFDSEISFIDDRIEQMSQRLEIKEQSLRKQFVAMEVSLAQSQAQQMWLSSQLGQLGGWGGNN